MWVVLSRDRVMRTVAQVHPGNIVGRIVTPFDQPNFVCDSAAFIQREEGPSSQRLRTANGE